MKTLGRTMIGSHIWNMNHENSDEDYFEIYLDSTKNLFRGTPKNKSTFTTKPVDLHKHELGKVVEQLLKGNINFLIGVTSPIVIESTKTFEELKKITYRNISKKTYHSIRGMAISNYKKYVGESNLDDVTNVEVPEHKCNQIIRAIQFGITLLKYRKLEYKPFKGGTPALIQSKIKELDEVYEKSTIPDEPNEEEFRDFLERTRKADWWNQVW